MEILELIKKRFSARSYKSDAVEQEKLNKIVECARFAPSAVNYQPWHFLIVKSKEQRLKVQQCYNREWFACAPVYIVVCADSSAAWVRKSDNKNHADIDAAIATEHICLAATALGLGSCWVCNFDVEMLKSHFQLSLEKYPVAIVTIGYVDELPKLSSTRKPVEEIVTFL